MSRFTYFLLLFIAIAAGWTLWYVTPAGLGLTNDSAAYIGGARSLLAGTGYSDIWLDSTREPITHYPPLLSLTLSGIGLLTGLDPYRAARALHIVLFAANTGLVGFLGWRMTRSQPAALLLALLLAANAQLLRIHAYVLSEPLFIFFSLLAFLSFDFALERQSSKNISDTLKTDYRSLKTGHWSLLTDYWLLLTGFLTGLAFLTRYSGLALIATFLAAIFLFQPDWRSRFVKIGQFLAGVLPPVAAWFVRNAIVAESATNRVFQYNAIELPNIRQGLRNFSQFLTPFESWQDWLFTSGVLTGMLLAIGLVLFGWLLYRTYHLLLGKSPTSALMFVTALYTFGYLGAVLFSMSFFDASTKFQHRILSPLYVSWMILLVAGLSELATKAQRHKENLVKNSLFFVVFTVGIFALGLSTFNFQRSFIELHDSAGLGYGSWKWRQSIIMARLKDLPPGVAIYTNSPPAVYHVTGRASRVLPSPVNPVSGQMRGSYEQDLAQLRADLLAGRAVLALFNTTDIEDALGVENLEDFSSGLTVLEKAQGDILYGKP